MRRVYLHTFGCKANQYDTEVVRQALEAVGVEPVEDPARADCAVVNSCTVTHVSEAKMRNLVRRIARANGESRTVVMGCAAAVDDGSIAALPGVTRVVTGADPHAVLEALNLPTSGVSDVLQAFRRGARAWLKIQDGCDEHCTFCATTVARGRNRSRSEAAILREAEYLSDEHDELVLTGVHIGSYGADRDDGSTLGSLVEQLVARVPRVRFRLSSVEATEVCQRLAALMIACPDRVAPHLHAPLQSGSDRVLKRMGRHWYTAAAYRDRIEWLAGELPHLGLGADIIVGFPGETSTDHQATCDLVEALPYTYLHVFPYSERPDAAARRLGRPVEGDIASRRAAELRAMAGAKAAAYRVVRNGGRADVVLLGRQRGRFEGMTEDYLTVYLPSTQSVPARFTARLHAEQDQMRAVPDEKG